MEAGAVQGSAVIGCLLHSAQAVSGYARRDAAPGQKLTRYELFFYQTAKLFPRQALPGERFAPRSAMFSGCAGGERWRYQFGRQHAIFRDVGGRKI
jgi:hypothetical protein